MNRVRLWKQLGHGHFDAGAADENPEKPATISRNEYDAFRKALQEDGFRRDWAEMNFESSTDQLQLKDQVRKVLAEPGSPAKIRKMPGRPTRAPERVCPSTVSPPAEPDRDGRFHRLSCRPLPTTS